MTTSITIPELRAVTEDLVRAAREGLHAELDWVPDEALLEFWNRMLDIVIGEQKG
jgi:hypothetical protein